MSIEQNVPDGTFVREIAGLVHADAIVHDVYRQKVLTVGKDVYKTFDDPSEPKPEQLKVSTLTAVIDYVTAKLAGEGVIVHVASPTEVNVVAPLVGDLRQKLVYLTSTPDLPEFKSRQFLNMEDFLIQLQSCVIQSDTRNALQNFCGKLKAGLSRDIDDDGVCQSVTVMKGLTQTEKVEVKNPWSLAPFRTFPEIDQPETAFVLRMRQRNPTADSLVAEAMLTDADGGAWRPKAIALIGAFLREHLPETVILA